MLFLFVILFSKQEVYSQVEPPVFCGVRKIAPVNSGSPNPMKSLFFVGPNGNSSYACNTDETLRFGGEPIPTVNWKPQLINYGTPGNYEGFNLSYRIEWYKLDNYSQNSEGNTICAGDWDTVGNSPNKYPQTRVGWTSGFSTFVPKSAGVPGFGVPAHQLDHTFELKKTNGDPLDPGWYQIDVVPSCDGGATYQDGVEASPGIFLSATFFTSNCEPPETVQNVSVSKPSNPNDNTSLLIDWDPPSDSLTSPPTADIYSYIVERTGPTGITTFDVPSDVTTFTDTGLTCGTSYTYSILAESCQTSRSIDVSAYTHSCSGAASNCTIVDYDTNFSCIQSGGTTYAFGVQNDPNPPMNSSYWNFSSPGSLFVVGYLGLAFKEFNDVNLYQSSTVNYSTPSGSCNRNFNIYPTGKLEVPIFMRPGGCSDTSSQVPVNDFTVELINASNYVYYGQTNRTYTLGPSVTGEGITGAGSPGIAIFDGMKTKQVSSFCQDENYKVAIYKSELISENYQACDDSYDSTYTSDLNWYDNGVNYKVENASPPIFDNSSTPVVSEKTLTPFYVEDRPPDPDKWINIEQGTFNSNTEYQADGKNSQYIVNENGMVFSGGTIELGDGNIGPQNGSKNVNIFEDYELNDINDLVTAFININVSQNIIKVTDDCDEIEDFNLTTDQRIMLFNSCNLVINDSVDVDINNLDLIIVSGGSLLIEKEVTQIDTSFIINGDTTFEEATSKLNEDFILNGFIVSNGVVSVGRDLYLNSDFDIYNITSNELIMPSGAARTYFVHID